MKKELLKTKYIKKNYLYVFEDYKWMGTFLNAWRFHFTLYFFLKELLFSITDSSIISSLSQKSNILWILFLKFNKVKIALYTYNLIQNDSLSKFRTIMLCYHDYMLWTFLATSLHIKSLEITGQFSEIELKF